MPQDHWHWLKLFLPYQLFSNIDIICHLVVTRVSAAIYHFAITRHHHQHHELGQFFFHTPKSKTCVCVCVWAIEIKHTQKSCKENI